MPGGFAFDWQFVVVSLAALWGGCALVKPLLRFRAARRASSPACARCAAGETCGTAQESPNGGLVTLGAGRASRAGTVKPPA